MEGRQILRSLVSKLIGLAVFIFLIVVINFIAPYMNSSIFQQVVNFINVNIVFLIILGVVFLIGDLFGFLDFPLNLPAPLINGVAGTLLVVFIFRIFSFVEGVLNENIFSVIEQFSYLIYIFVFVLIVLIGYLVIFSNLGRRHKKRHSEREERRKGNKRRE